MFPSKVQSLQNVLLAFDGSEHAWAAVLLSRDLLPPRATAAPPISVLLRGDAAAEIIEYAKTRQVDLIVAGSRGLGTIKGWLLGSVSRKLAHYAPCSVLIVRGGSHDAVG